MVSVVFRLLVLGSLIPLIRGKTTCTDEVKNGDDEPPAYEPLFNVDPLDYQAIIVEPPSIEEEFSSQDEGEVITVHHAEKVAPEDHTPESSLAATARRLLTPHGTLATYATDLWRGAASSNNTNPHEPEPAIYPGVETADARYTVPEARLRAALHIPATFRYGAPGAPPPVLLVGGTGNPGYVSFAGSYIPLLLGSRSSAQGDAFADPVWLNIPRHSLDDYQTNAEYVAYALHYLSSLCNRQQVGLIGYSQGNLDAQWAFKHWPSSRALVSHHVALSPGYRGTRLNTGWAARRVPQPPGWRQAMWDSAWVRALRADGGDDAYVPTTVVYSATDNIVFPQTKPDGPSAVLGDERGVGVRNVAVQDVCGGRGRGGWYYTHESIMVSPVAYALARDALAGEGKGEGLDWDKICSTYMAPMLGWQDFVVNELTVLYSAVATLLYRGKTTVEPAIRDFPGSAS